MVYIQEAHPSDGWQLDSNLEDEVVFETPFAFADRLAIAQGCVVDLGISFPALIDDMNNSVDKAYTSWPDRIYLVDRDGRIAHKSPPGPWGFETKELREALHEMFPDIELEQEEEDEEGGSEEEEAAEEEEVQQEEK